MRTRLYLNPMAACMLALLPAASCKKSDDTGPVTRFDLLVGRWEAYAAAIDVNRNGSAEAAEHYNIDSADVYFFTFNPDGTALYEDRTISRPIAMKWELLNNDRDLRMHVGTKADSFAWLMKIDILTTSRLTTYDTIRDYPTFTDMMKR